MGIADGLVIGVMVGISVAVWVGRFVRVAVGVDVGRNRIILEVLGEVKFINNGWQAELASKNTNMRYR
jgi:hypothetical protein